MSDEKDTSVRLNERDRTMAAYLAKKMARETGSSGCPPLEAIAAFIDGRLSGPERASVNAHLGDCRECYAVFSSALKGQDEMARKNGSWKRRAVFYGLPAAIAAAVLLVASIRFLSSPGPELNRAARQNVLPSRPLPERMAGLLAKNDGMNNAAGYIDPERKKGFGFSDAQTPERSAFRIGVYAMDLEVSLISNDREKAMDTLNKLIAVLMPMANAEETTAYYKNILTTVEQGGQLRQFIFTSGKAQAYAGRSNLTAFSDLGAWAEMMNIAARMAKAGKTEIMTAILRQLNEADRLRNELSGRNVPGPVIDSLRVISGIAGAQTPGMKEIDVILTEAANIKSEMM